MKYFAFLTILIFISYILGFIKKPTSFDWMDRSFTTAIKGFSILTVVWAHTGARLGVGGIQFIAGIGVSLFLICSGYGLEMSYQKNGLKGFWKKRLLGVCLPFWLVELIGLLVTGSFTIEKYVLDAFFLKPATSYGWFMGYIIVCYFIFYAINNFTTNFIGFIRSLCGLVYYRILVFGKGRHAGFACKTNAVVPMWNIACKA